MLDFNIMLPAVFIDSAKPFFHSRIQLDIFPQRDEIAAADRLPRQVGLVEHHIHIRQDAVHFLTFRQRGHLAPELRRFDPQRRNKTEFLHILRRQCFIKIIHDRQLCCFQRSSLVSFLISIVTFF